MILAYRVTFGKEDKPFRVDIDGKQVLNKNGEPVKFHSMLEALSFAQRQIQKDRRKHGGK